MGQVEILIDPYFTKQIDLRNFVICFLIFNGDTLLYDPNIFAYVYFDTVSGVNCDTIVHYYIEILSSSSSSFTMTECDSYDWNGNTYTSSGTYTWVGTNSEGCDSTATLYLTINSSNSSTFTTTECDSYEWNGNTYSKLGNIYLGWN